MKPETQYRLLVKVASADRATRVLAMGALNLRRNMQKKADSASDAADNKYEEIYKANRPGSPKDREEQAGAAYMENRRKAQTNENLQSEYFKRLREEGPEAANAWFAEASGTQQKQIETQDKNTKGLQHINEVGTKYPYLTNFQVPIGEEAAAAAAVDNKLKSNRNWGIGAGIGGGALLAGGTYGALGLIPALKRRRLARLIAALGVGGVGGTALGMATQEGLNTGAIQGMYNKVRSKIG